MVLDLLKGKSDNNNLEELLEALRAFLFSFSLNVTDTSLRADERC